MPCSPIATVLFPHKLHTMKFTDQELSNLTSAVIALSRETGDWMKQQTIAEGTAELKSFNNLVTFVDKEGERRFVEGLSRILPEAGFVAEEGTGTPSPNDLNWVIDPLDGTTNFVHGMPVWCTSIALVQGCTPLLGVIYDPNLNEMYHASRGAGAKLNDKPVRVSSKAHLMEALLATGFPYDDFAREHLYYELLKALAHKTRGMRRLGSAALDMAWTACGRLDGFYEYGLSPWDVAAGTILIREAGGVATTFKGGDDPIFGRDLVCANPQVYPQLIAEIRSIFG